MKIALIGNGDLSQALEQRFGSQHSISVFDKKFADISQQQDCQELVDAVKTFDCIIVTTGLYVGNAWELFTVNAVGPCYLLSQLIDCGFTGHCVFVSSHGANWTSWPGADLQKLTYNCAKQTLSNYVKAVQHSGVSGRYSLIEPSRFSSRMSEYTGQDIDNVVNAVEYIVSNPAKSITV